MAGTNLFNMLNYGPTNRGGLGLSLEEERKRKEEEVRQAQIDQWLAAREAGGIEPHGNPSENGFFSKLKDVFAPKTISEAEAERLKNSPVHIIEETDLSKKGMRPVVDASGNVTGSGMHPGEETGYQPLGTRNPIPSEVTVPNSGVPQLGIPDKTIYRTPQGTPAVGSGPKKTPEARQKYKDYTKQLDSSFIAAALQSSIPEGDQLFKPKEGRGGAYGGGPIPEMTQFLSAERRKKKNPSLWRYS